MTILGLETSCDETAAAIVDNDRVLSSVVATQHDLHRRYSGVVPEIASRAHLQRIVPVIREALAGAGVTLGDLGAIAVGHRPGLIGSLLVGTSAAKTLAWSLGVPLVGVDHIAAHLHAGLLHGRDDPPPPPVSYPALGLVVSGGHTSLMRLHGPLDIELIGRTIDDAVGEAYDKAAVILDLGYPGGPEVDRLAASGDERAHALPVAQLGRDRLDFSFSGLKTALLYAARGRPGEATPPPLNDTQRADFAASFQRAAVTAVIRKVRRALESHETSTLLVGGGVSANSRLRRELTELATECDLDLRLPPMAWCRDNAAMIAGLAAVKLAAGRCDGWSLSASTRSDVRDGRLAV